MEVHWRVYSTIGDNEKIWDWTDDMVSMAVVWLFEWWYGSGDDGVVMLVVNLWCESDGVVVVAV